MHVADMCGDYIKFNSRAKGTQARQHGLEISCRLWREENLEPTASLSRNTFAIVTLRQTVAPYYNSPKRDCHPHQQHLTHNHHQWDHHLRICVTVIVSTMFITIVMFIIMTTVISALTHAIRRCRSHRRYCHPHTALIMTEPVFHPPTLHHHPVSPKRLFVPASLHIQALKPHP